MPLAEEMDLATVERLILDAAAELLTQDRHLLECDANERSITHKFAEHLQRRFPDWHVDCEYDRDGHDVKRLTLAGRFNIKCDDVSATTVYPDIIIHSRGTCENLAVIEVKKSTNPRRDGP